MRRKPANLVALIFFLAAAVYYGVMERHQPEKHAFPPSVGREVTAAVTSVSDGDTLTVVTERGEEKIRLIGIDAPELAQRPWGARAKKQLEKLVAQSLYQVRIEYDVDERDKYGRLLAYVFTREGLFINEDLLRNGFAVLYTFPPNVKYVERFTAAQKFAQDTRAGIWGKGGLGTMPSDYRREHPRGG
ncbi:MAG: hypothetical protein OHK006_07370 [Thermodesulfovibrionales bacterium]